MEIQNPKNSHIQRKSRSSSIIIGAIFIVVGAILIGANFDLLPNNIHRVIISWQMLLIVIGIIQLSKHNTTSGIILLLIGGFFIIPRLSYIFPAMFSWVGYNFAGNFWPLLLIVAGILIIASRRTDSGWSGKTRSRQYNRCYHNEQKEYNNYREDSNNYYQGGNFHRSGFSPLNGSNLFNEKEYIVLDEIFPGGNIKTVFGETVIDLRNTSLKEGETLLNLEVVFGSVKIYVPNDWYIEFRIENVLGCIEDHRMTSATADSSKKLVIVGKCVFGGGEIRN